MKCNPTPLLDSEACLWLLLLDLESHRSMCKNLTIYSDKYDLSWSWLHVNTVMATLHKSASILITKNKEMHPKLHHKPFYILIAHSHKLEAARLTATPPQSKTTGGKVQRDLFTQICNKSWNCWFYSALVLLSPTKILQKLFVLFAAKN